MKNRFEEFLALPKNKEALLLGNAWNAQSAKVLDKQFKVIGTSSAAVADSLGFADGEAMTFDEYLFIIKRIAASTQAILTVDLEAGYGETPEQISTNIAQLYSLGVSGINIEDSVVINGQRSIMDAEAFAEKLKQIVKLLGASNINMFINVRSDSFLLGLPNALEDALSRVRLYQTTGVHGLFFPCITDLADIKAVTGQSKLPVNVMCMPNLPNFEQLQKMGVKRISIGPFLNMKIYKEMEALVEKILTSGSFNCLF